MTPASDSLRAPRLINPVTESDSAAIIRGARRVLDEIGVECRAPEICQQLLNLKGARHANGRIYYGEAAVDAVFECVTKAAASHPRPTLEDLQKPFGFGGPFCCLQLADARQARVCEPTMEDAVRGARLLTGLGATVGYSPLAPSVGLSPAARNLAGLRVALLHTPTACTLTNPPLPEQIPIACEMAAAAGRVPKAFLMCMVSPLRFEENMLNYFLQHRHRPGFHIWLSAGMPCVGSTSPIHLPGALIQSLAETLAVACAELALGCTPGIIGVRSDPFDMRFATYVIGSPEYQLLDLTCRAVFKAINGFEQSWGAFRSMAKLPDAQASIERSLTVLFQALQGARSFSYAGQLSMDEVFSPEQAVIDLEILRQVERIVRGQRWRQESTGSVAVDEALELIRQGAAAGNYLELDHTLQNYRDFFHSSELLRYESAGTWERMGAETILQRASQRVEKIIQSTPEYAVPEDRARQVDKIFNAFKATLQ